MYDREYGWLDAGMVPVESRGEIRFTDYDIMEAQDAGFYFRKLELYANQLSRMEEDFFSRDIVVCWKFQIPCITTLGGNNED